MKQTHTHVTNWFLTNVKAISGEDSISINGFGITRHTYKKKEVLFHTLYKITHARSKHRM